MRLARRAAFLARQATSFHSVSSFLLYWAETFNSIHTAILFKSLAAALCFCT